MSVLPTFSEDYNKLLEGGFQKGIITGIYGEAASGKTLACILAMLGKDLKGKKIIYIDTEKGLDLERVKQVSKDYNETLKNLMIFQKKEFPELKKVCEDLNRLVNDKFGLIIVDTISAPYRIEIARKSDLKQLNQDFSDLIGNLSAIAKRFDIPIVVTSQVYADFKEKDKVIPIGGTIFKNRCRCIIEIQKLNLNNRRAIIKKHPSIPEGKYMHFRIVSDGIKGF